MNSPLPPFPLPHHQPFTILEFVLNSQVYTHIPPPTLHRPTQKFLPQPLSDALLNQSDRDVTHTLRGVGFLQGPLWLVTPPQKSVCVTVHCSDSLLSVTSDQVCVWESGLWWASVVVWCVCVWPDWWKLTLCWLTKQQWAPAGRQMDGESGRFPPKPESVGAKYLWLLHTTFRNYAVNETACNSTNLKVRFCMGQSSSVSASGCLSLLSPEYRPPWGQWQWHGEDQYHTRTGAQRKGINGGAKGLGNGILRLTFHLYST